MFSASFHDKRYLKALRRDDLISVVLRNFRSQVPGKVFKIGHAAHFNASLVYFSAT
jgi:hypothetical protein